MSGPELLRLNVMLSIEDMRAYVMRAFDSKTVEPVLEQAFQRAMAEAPARIQRDINEAVNGSLQKAIAAVVHPWDMQEQFAKKLRPVVLRMLADCYAEAADRAEKEGGK